MSNKHYPLKRIDNKMDWCQPHKRCNCLLMELGKGCLTFEYKTQARLRAMRREQVLGWLTRTEKAYDAFRGLGRWMWLMGAWGQERMCPNRGWKDGSLESRPVRALIWHWHVMCYPLGKGSHCRLSWRRGTRALHLRKIFVAATWRLGTDRGSGDYVEWWSVSMGMTVGIKRKGLFQDIFRRKKNQYHFLTDWYRH